jgi:hypothetical protein
VQRGRGRHGGALLASRDRGRADDGDGAARAAAGGVLRQLVPGRGDRRAAGGQQGRRDQPGPRRRPAPAPLPRLLRQGQFTHGQIKQSSSD